MADGRGKLRRRILDHLVIQSKGRIKLVSHFGDRDGDFHAACLSRMEIRKGRKGHLTEAYGGSGANIQLLASDHYHWLLEQGVEQLQRNSSNYKYRAHNLHHLQDYLDYYHILADAYAQEIEKTRATHILFMNMPHLGYDIILYHVAKTLGLKILVCSQTFFSDSFFSMENLEHFGSLSPDGMDGSPVLIEKGSLPETSNTNYFSNDDRWQKTGPRGRLRTKAVISLFKYVALRQPMRLVNLSYLIGNVKRMAEIYSKLPDWRDPFSSFFHQNELAYFEHLSEYEMQQVDFRKPYVYIPLHNQPEMSTQTLGGKFRDQLLVVEAISRSLPDGWHIYVKENPRQGGYARGPMFFHRLSRINGVQFLPAATSTHELTKGCKVLATTGGTAGYEALRKGKPVVVFGRTWYRDFPGVFPWNESLDLQLISETSFPHEELEKAMGFLQGRCHPGQMELLYERASEGPESEANVRGVAQIISDLLEKKCPLTFQKAD